MRTLFLLSTIFLFSGCIGIGTVVSDKQIYQSKQSVSKEDILATKGEPYKKVINDNHESWFYRRELAWGGVIVDIVFLPIPFLLPYGYRDTIINFKDNNQTSTEEEYGNTSTFLCGPLVPMIHGAKGDDFCSTFSNIY